MEHSEESVFGKQRLKLVREVFNVETEDGQTLVMVRKRAAPLKRKKGAPVVLLHGLGQNRFSWHLSKMSLANYLAGRGMDVYIPELRGHGLSRMAGSDHPRSFSEYVFRDVPALLRTIRKKTNQRKIFLCGHSLGGTIAYALNPSEQEHLGGIITIGGPSHFGRGMVLLKAISIYLYLAHRITPLRAIDLFNERTPFPVDWIGRLMHLGLGLFDSHANPIPYTIWYPGSMDPEVLEERILKGFDRTSLEVVKQMILWAAKGRFCNEDGEEIYERNMRAKDLPVLFILGDRDSSVPESSVRPAYDAMPSADKTWKVFNRQDNRVHWGHCDMIFGREAPAEVWPYLARWIEQR